MADFTLLNAWSLEKRKFNISNLKSIRPYTLLGEIIFPSAEVSDPKLMEWRGTKCCWIYSQKQTAKLAFRRYQDGRSLFLRQSTIHKRSTLTHVHSLPLPAIIRLYTAMPAVFPVYPNSNSLLPFEWFVCTDASDNALRRYTQHVSLDVLRNSDGHATAQPFSSS